MRSVTDQLAESAILPAVPRSPPAVVESPPAPTVTPPLPTFHPSDALLERLAGGSRPVVFLVGSALTMSVAGSPGVSNVTQVIDLIRARVATPKGTTPQARMDALLAGRRLDELLAKAPEGGARYQLAFDHIKGWVDGADSCNAVVREAVLRARMAPIPAPLPAAEALTQLEASPDGWYLGRAAKALGLLLTRHRARFGRIVLTTNFDPLVEIAMRSAGGHAIAVDQFADGALPSADPQVTPVVHLHGLWRSDTLHTPRALTLERGALRRSLARLYDEVSLVVMGYGGWDDVLTAALSELAEDKAAKIDVLWCFFESDPNLIVQRYPKVLEVLAKLRERSVCYSGVDCHHVLPKLRARLDGEHELIGRSAICNALIDALHAQQAVEIVGERKMKRTELLTWVADQSKPFDTRVACFSARELACATPEALVRKVAQETERKVEVEAELVRRRSVPNAEDVARALNLLRGTAILIDDAEALAAEGHEFTGTFFAELRSKVQARELLWISVSSTPLGELFEERGLTSQFLNDATRIYAGGLDRREVEVALSARLGRRMNEALELTGTFPELVYRALDAEWGDVEQALQGLSPWAGGLCELWWRRRPNEQALLKRIANGLPAAEMSSRDRSDTDELCKRGLLVETGDGFALNGSIWEAYVRTRG